MSTANQPLQEAPAAPATPVSALFSFIMGIFSFVCLLLTGIPAIISGHIALARIRNSQKPLNGKGFAICGIIMGWFSILVTIAIAALFALGIREIPKIGQAMAAATDEKALESATNLKSSIEAYYAEYEKFPFPKTLAVGSKTEANDAVLRVLTGKELAGADILNPKGLVFFEGKESSFDMFGQPVDGVHRDSDGKARFLDPWGNPFKIKLNPKTPGNEEVTVSVWSVGRDKKDGTKDDVLIAQ